MLLAHRVVGPEAGPADSVAGDLAPTAFLVHGILGSGTNLTGLARGLARLHPTWRFVLPDLRGHGDSQGAPPPHTVAACAADLEALAAELGAPSVVVGHSFGGKVVLALAQALGTVDHVWMLDTPPGAAAGGADHEVRRVVAAARSLPAVLPSREAVSSHFLAAGLSPAIATWMTTNVGRRPEGLVFRPDLATIEALLDDYFRQDAWGPLEAPPPGLGLHVVRAGRSDRWMPADLERLAALAIDVRVLPEAGHWVHVDDPAGVMALVGESLT